jgi:hypothetical protein
MALVVDGPYGGLDVVPATLIVESTPDAGGDERTAAAPAHATVELTYEHVVEAYV